MSTTMEAEIEAVIDDQIATGEWGPEPHIPGRKSRKDGKSVVQIGEAPLPTYETAFFGDGPMPKPVPGITVDEEFAEYERFMKRAALLDIEIA